MKPEAAHGDRQAYEAGWDNGHTMGLYKAMWAAADLTAAMTDPQAKAAGETIVAELTRLWRETQQ